MKKCTLPFECCLGSTQISAARVALVDLTFVYSLIRNASSSTSILRCFSAVLLLSVRPIYTFCILAFFLASFFSSFLLLICSWVQSMPSLPRHLHWPYLSHLPAFWTNLLVFIVIFVIGRRFSTKSKCGTRKSCTPLDNVSSSNPSSSFSGASSPPEGSAVAAWNSCPRKTVLGNTR